MKGVITSCLALLVETQYGADKWRAIMKDAGAEAVAGLRLATSDVNDAIAARLFESTARVLGLSLEQAMDAFGDYWCGTYAPAIYKNDYKRFTSAREMILGMDYVHVAVTQNSSNGRPPRFDFTWEDERTVLVTYRSSRNMIDLYVGIARGVGKYFKERLTVRKVSPDQCRIRFG
jgi:hypothetical protein